MRAAKAVKAMLVLKAVVMGPKVTGIMVVVPFLAGDTVLARAVVAIPALMVEERLEKVVAEVVSVAMAELRTQSSSSFSLQRELHFGRKQSKWHRPIHPLMSNSS